MYVCACARNIAPPTYVRANSTRTLALLRNPLFPTGHIEGAVTCPTRQLKRLEGDNVFRRRLAVVSGDNIVEVANQLYGYAHAGGYVMF